MPPLPKWLVRRLLGKAEETAEDAPETRYPAPRPDVRRAKRLNSAQVDLLVKEYKSGKTVYELAAQFGIHRVTVGQHLARRGVRMRMRGLDAEQWPEVQRLRAEGWSYVRLGERFGVAPSTVRNFVPRGGQAGRHRHGSAA
jgi:DNA-binding CsgD family transcriptional regulator